MDIHRCRFVPYPQSTINALAFSNAVISHQENHAPPRLAVGRENGDIEIWNPLNGSWLQETIIRGGKDRSIDGLLWTQDPSEELENGDIIVGKSRLFSIGYTTTITEWDIIKGQPRHQANGNHGEIWCFAAQPVVSEEVVTGRPSLFQSQHLVAGCTDGSLILYSTEDDTLQFSRTISRLSTKKAKVVSIAFQDRNIVVGGFSDSVIRIYDVRNGQSIRNMSLGSGKEGGPKDNIVWAVKVLSNGDIVSGDSSGEVKIWNGKTYTLMQRMKSHEQDVLSLATSFDGKIIFSGGMDRRTVSYKLVEHGKHRWAAVNHTRHHTHDVKTMASLETSGLSVVVSGGPDASPMVHPLRNFNPEASPRILPFFPQQNQIHSSPRARIMMGWWDREVHIWRLSKRPTDFHDDDLSTEERRLLAKILIKGEESITSATLSTDGRLLAVSTITDIKVFRLKPRQKHENGGLKVTRLALPHSISIGARLVSFSPDCKWLCIISEDSCIELARLVQDGVNTSSLRFLPQSAKLRRLERHGERHVLLGGLGTYDRTITQAIFSSNSRIFVVSDIAGYLDSWVLTGHQDTEHHTSDVIYSDSSDSGSDSRSEDAARNLSRMNGQRWLRSPSAKLLPKLPSTPTVLSFRPSASSLSSGENYGTIPMHNPTGTPLILTPCQ